MHQKNIAIADDHRMLREGLSGYLSSCGFNVMIKASNGAELLSAIQENTALPDSCLIDMNMPGMDGLQTLQKIKQQWPDIRVIIYTMSGDAKLKAQCLHWGADGYILKGTNDSEIIRLLTGN